MSKANKTDKKDIVSQIQIVLTSGKYVSGYKKVIKSIISGNTKCIIASNNIPYIMRKKLEYYCGLANKTPLKFLDGNMKDLSSAFALSYNTSVVSIIDQGEADLVNKAV